MGKDTKCLIESREITGQGVWGSLVNIREQCAHRYSSELTSQYFPPCENLSFTHTYALLVGTRLGPCQNLCQHVITVPVAWNYCYFKLCENMADEAMSKSLGTSLQMSQLSCLQMNLWSIDLSMLWVPTTYEGLSLRGFKLSRIWASGALITVNVQWQPLFSSATCSSSGLCCQLCSVLPGKRALDGSCVSCQTTRFPLPLGLDTEHMGGTLMD